jgi:hypothetical protein
MFLVEPFLIGKLYLFYGIFSLTALPIISKLLKQKLSFFRMAMGVLIFFIGSLVLSNILFGWVFFKNNTYINYGSLKGLFYVLSCISFSMIIINPLIQKFVLGQEKRIIYKSSVFLFLFLTVMAFFLTIIV